MLRAFVFRFPQVHIGIGVLGNTLFLLGSCGMLVGSVGEGLRALCRRRLVRLDVDPGPPGPLLVAHPGALVPT